MGTNYILSTWLSSSCVSSRARRDACLGLATLLRQLDSGTVVSFFAVMIPSLILLCWVPSLCPTPIPFSTLVLLGPYAPEQSWLLPESVFLFLDGCFSLSWRVKTRALGWTKDGSMGGQRPCHWLHYSHGLMFIGPLLNFFILCIYICECLYTYIYIHTNIQTYVHNYINLASRNLRGWYHLTPYSLSRQTQSQTWTN